MSYLKFSIILVYSSEFLIQVSRKLPFVIPTIVVKQRAKVHEPLVIVFIEKLKFVFCLVADLHSATCSLRFC